MTPAERQAVREETLRLAHAALVDIAVRGCDGEHADHHPHDCPDMPTVGCGQNCKCTSHVAARALAAMHARLAAPPVPPVPEAPSEAPAVEVRWSRGVVIAVADELSQRACGKRFVALSDWAQDRYFEDARRLLDGPAAQPPPVATEGKREGDSELYEGADEWFDKGNYDE